MAITLDQVAHNCSFVDNTASVSLGWTADGLPHTFEVTLKQAGVPIYSHTGTLVSGYTFPSVAAGTYDAQVSSASMGSSNVISITFDCSPTPFSISEFHVPPTYPGASDGSINITGSGGYTPYTYAWDDGPTTEDRTGLPAGSYHVVATSADSQTDDLTIVLIDPVCDLTITNIAIVKESLRRVADATVTITATTTNPATKEYSLNNTTWQTSNVFSGLSEGNYTAYTRQGICSDSEPFTIARRDAKYWMQYHDLVGNTTLVELLEKNFSGTAERLCGSGTPLTIKWQGEGDERYEVLKGSEATVEFQSATDFKFLDLFTADNRKYRIDVYKFQGNSTPYLFWTGFVLPELYSEPYTPAPYFVQLKAVDGLGMLKYTPFSLTSASISQFDVVQHILSTLDLHIPLVIADDLYETQMEDSLDDEPMVQALINCGQYVQEGKRLNSAEVLEANLRIKYARIFQDRGAIRIARYDQLRGIYGHRVYDKRGDFAFSQYINPVQAIQTPQAPEVYPFFVNKNANMEVKTALRSLTAKLLYGTESNLLVDGDFGPDAFNEAGNALLNWTDTANIASRQPYPGVYTVAITDNGTTPGFKITSRPVYLYEGEGNSISLRFDYYVKSSVLGSDSPIVPYQIKIGTQYWTGSAWTATPTIIEEDPAQVNHTSRIQYTMIPIPEDGEFTLSLYAVIPHDFTVEEVQYSNAYGQFLPLGSSPPTSASYEVSQDIPYTFIPDDIEALHGDTPSPVFASAITIELPDTSLSASVEWKRRTVTEEKPLLQILIEAIAAGYLTPTQKLTGDIKGNYRFGLAIQHAFNSNRVFVPNGGTLDDKAGIWSGEWLEALAVQPAPEEDAEPDNVLVLGTGEIDT